METSKLKNMVVLRNLPSNLVDEAIIVLKSNKKIKKLEKIEKNRGTSLEKTKKDKEYILKEAEMIVNEYMSKIENEAKIKYKKLRKYAIVTTIICAIQTILLIVL